MEGDGNRTIMNGRGQDAHAGEGFGTKDVSRRRCDLIYSSTFASCHQQASYSGIGGAKGVLAFVEQDGGAGADDFSGQDAWTDSGRVPGMGAYKTKQIQAEAFTRLLFG